MTDATALDSAPATQADIVELRADIDTLRTDVDQQFVELATDPQHTLPAGEDREDDFRRAVVARFDRTDQVIEAGLEESARISGRG